MRGERAVVPVAREGARYSACGTEVVVVAVDGSATVVEFKTGSPQPGHERQAALYARAVEAATGRPATARLVYA